MARLTDLDGVHKSQSYTIDNPALIQVIRGFNARKKFNITDLAKDIDECGLLNPLWVRRDRANEEQPFILIDGERRLRALNKLFAKEPTREERIPIIIFDVDEEQAEDLMAKANLEREDFTLSERIGLVQRYLKRGIEVAEVGARLNRSDGWVNNMVTLKGASTKVKNAVDAGQITFSAALMIARKTKAADQEDMVDRVVKMSGGKKSKTTKAAAKTTGTSVRPGKKELLRVASALETKEVEGEGVGADAARGLVLMALSYAAGEADRDALLEACADALKLSKPEEPEEEASEEQEAASGATSEEDAGKKSEPEGDGESILADDEDD